MFILKQMDSLKKKTRMLINVRLYSSYVYVPLFCDGYDFHVITECRILGIYMYFLLILFSITLIWLK